MRPNRAGYAPRPRQPHDRNALGTVLPVLAVELAGKARGVKVSSAEVALELVLVLVGVGAYSPSSDRDYCSGGGITFKVVGPDLDPSIHEADIYRGLWGFVAAGWATDKE
jgi:hypothetical protein